MKNSLNIVKFMVCMCIFSSTPLLTYAACCNSCPIQPCDCPTPETFVPVFGSWFIPGSTGVPVAPGDEIPFAIAEATPVGILNNAGTFTFLNPGTYAAHIGIAAQLEEGAPFFDLVRNPGTENFIIKEIMGNEFDFRGLDTVTVQFTVATGDTVQLINVSATTATIGAGIAQGPNPASMNAAFISFERLEKFILDQK